MVERYWARRVLEQGWSKAEAAAAFGVSIKTAGKWIARFAAEGEAGVADRSSEPKHAPNRTNAAIEAEIVALSCQRRTGAAIVQALGVSAATVSRVLKRHRLSRPRAGLAFYAGLGVRAERVMTDNGSAYRSKAFKAALARHGLKHICTKPYPPKTNGKAERFIQTCLREWAYACAYENSEARAAAMPDWLHRYNWHRPHSALKGKPPISRLGLDRNNVLRLHS